MGGFDMSNNENQSDEPRSGEITKKEREDLIELKRRELDIRDREVIAIENQNRKSKNRYLLLGFLIIISLCIIVFILLWMNQPESRSPSITPLPSSIQVEDTPQGTILEADQIWRQGGAELKMVPDINEKFIWIGLEFTNRKPQQIHVKPVEPRVVDNFNISYDSSRGVDTPCSLNPGKTCKWSFEYWLDITDPGLSELIVTIDNLSSISNAKWRIPVYH